MEYKLNFFITVGIIVRRIIFEREKKINRWLKRKRNEPALIRFPWENQNSSCIFPLILASVPSRVEISPSKNKDPSDDLQYLWPLYVAHASYQQQTMCRPRSNTHSPTSLNIHRPLRHSSHRLVVASCIRHSRSAAKITHEYMPRKPRGGGITHLLRPPTRSIPTFGRPAESHRAHVRFLRLSFLPGLSLSLSRQSSIVILAVDSRRYNSPLVAHTGAMY